MAWWRFRRFWFFVLLCGLTETCSGDGHCDSCRSPLMQNVRVPWARFLKNTTQTFYGPVFGSMTVLPNNSFVLSPFIYVCIHTSCPYTCWETVSFNTRSTNYMVTLSIIAESCLLCKLGPGILTIIIPLLFLYWNLRYNMYLYLNVVYNNIIMIIVFIAGFHSMYSEIHGSHM